MRKTSQSLFAEAGANANTHASVEDLAWYVDAFRFGMKEKLSARLVEHVENCHHCQGQIMDVLFYLRDPQREPDTASVRKVFPAKKRLPIWFFPASRIAAAAFAFILLMTFFFFLPRRQVLDSSGGSKADAPLPPVLATHSQKAPAKDSSPEPASGAASRTIAAVTHKGNAGKSENRDAFAVNPNLESMVGSRSRGLNIEVYSPPNRVTLSREITFSWKEFSHEPLSLTIVDNHNELLFKIPVSGGHFLFRSLLPAGCYYWKLESATELYYVGKFFVNDVPRSPKE
jgi:hypothetical protein